MADDMDEPLPAELKTLAHTPETMIRGRFSAILTKSLPASSEASLGAVSIPADDGRSTVELRVANASDDVERAAAMTIVQNYLGALGVRFEVKPDAHAEGRVTFDRDEFNAASKKSNDVKVFLQTLVEESRGYTDSNTSAQIMLTPERINNPGAERMEISVGTRGDQRSKIAILNFIRTRLKQHSIPVEPVNDAHGKITALKLRLDDVPNELLDTSKAAQEPSFALRIAGEEPPAKPARAASEHFTLRLAQSATGRDDGGKTPA